MVLRKLSIAFLFALIGIWGGSTAQATVSLTLVPSASSVALGGTLTLRATVSGTTDTSLTWSVDGVTNGSSTTGTLSGSGLTRTYKAPSVDTPSPNPVTFKIVSAADTAVSKTATATVTDSIVVTLSPSSSSRALGGTQLFTASVSGTSNTTLNWYVNGVLNGSSTQGTLTGSGLSRTYKAPTENVPSPNPAVIKVVSAADPTKYKTASVTVTDSIALTLSPASTSKALGTTQLFTATISGTTDTTLEWYVNGVLNGSSTQGTLTGSGLSRTYKAPTENVPSPNPAVIKVVSAADPAKYKTASVTVTDSIALTLSPASTSKALGTTQLFTATISGTTDTTLEWYVNGVLNGSSTQGTLTGSGLTRTYAAPSVNVPSPNPAVVKVVSAADPTKYKTATVTVTDSIAVGLSPTAKTLALGATQLFTATISGSSDTALNWYVNGVLNGSSTQGTLTGSGLTRTYKAPSVNPPSPNPAVIKVASVADPGKSKTASVTVESATIAVTLSPTSASLAPGGAQVFTATISGTTNTTLDWYVNGVQNGDSSQGTITACTTSAPLTCKYTAPSGSPPSPNPAMIKVASAADTAVYKTANVTVTTAVLLSITSPSSPQNVAVGHTLPITASLSGSSNNAVTWTVNGVTNGNSTYGTISGTGLSVTYNAPGAVPSPASFNIKVTSQADSSKSATLAVTIKGVSNLASVTVSFGPNGYSGGYYDGIFTTVTVCQPGTTTCATVPNVLVDTGSVGLRVLSDQIEGVSLPAITDGSGDYLYGCTEYGDTSYTWGPMEMATVQIGGETASQIPAAAGGSANAGIPIQVITAGGGAPSGAPCMLDGGPSDNSVTALGANGILGVGNFPQDCGAYCESAPSDYNSPPWPYLLVNTSTWNYAEPVPLSVQAWNPVAAFSSGDNNGVMVQIPSISSSGAATVTGNLIFGIGTQSNNAIPGTATIYELDNNGNFESATYGGVSYTSSNSYGTFIDSGSNALYVLDSATIGSVSGVSTPICSDNGYYCPASSLALDITLAGSNGTSGAATLNIANADTLFLNNTNAAFDNLGGSSGGTGESTDYFDLGLPFFFGRTIFVGIAGDSSSYPNGYWAF